MNAWTKERAKKGRVPQAQKERKDQLPASGKYLRTQSVRFHHWGRLPLPHVDLWERGRDQLPASGKYLRTQSVRGNSNPRFLRATRSLVCSRGEILFKTCTKNKVQKIKKNKKSLYLSTARKVPVGRYEQASKTYFRTEVPVDSSSVACRQPLTGKGFPNFLSSAC
ncbi:hypothetical protein Taro_012336 [Colocasia esculenta]|uniref:Uncharacterized protein n=1 Tax=Colocasia esculenta TaxID=4460 RepID=A0A843U8G9_COLES|nr:hypothetical protein [Colocasia esculenta]